MGFAIARACAEQGAQVTLITGPVSISIQHPNIHRIDVVSADEMFEATNTVFASTDIAVFCAAVADFTPDAPQQQKTKRDKQDWHLTLKPTRDIAATMGAEKQAHQLLVGFALETNDEEFNAQKKLEKKNLDLIVLNSLNDKGAGFMKDTNKVTLFHKNGHSHALPLLPKSEVAEKLVDEMARLLP